MVHKKLVTKSFFNDNPPKENSTQRYVYSLLLYDGFEEKAGQLVAEMSSTRAEAAETELKTIQAQTDADSILRWLRKGTDALNRTTLRDMALEHQDELMPAMLDMLKRSYNSNFIENATRFFRYCKQEYVDQLLHAYAEIRNPYVQSLMCIVLGFRASEDAIPWMKDQYTEMKRRYPNEDYEQGPLLALYELNARFYIDK